MRVTIDNDRPPQAGGAPSAGHGVCAILRPEVFALNDDGYAEVQPTDISFEFEGDVQEAIESGPEHAITEQ